MMFCQHLWFMIQIQFKFLALHLKFRDENRNQAVKANYLINPSVPGTLSYDFIFPNV